MIARWRIRLLDALGWMLCELAFRMDCCSPFAWCYRAGCWCYGKAIAINPTP
jgi:hypothetical protein